MDLHLAQNQLRGENAYFILRKTEGFPQGAKGSLQYFTALSDGVVTRLNIIVTQKSKFFIIFQDILKANIDHSSKTNSVTDCYFLLLLGLRLNDLLIVRGINPLVILCLGFQNKIPRNTISAMKIRVSITGGLCWSWCYGSATVTLRLFSIIREITHL